MQVKTIHTAHARAETKVNSRRVDEDLYGVIHDVLDTWQEMWPVCVCMPLSLCLWRADGGSGHTSPDREAIETPRPTPLLSLVHKRPRYDLRPHWNPFWLGESTRSGPAVNNAQWSVRGRGGGGGGSLPLVPPSAQTQKSSSVTTRREQTASLFSSSGGWKELWMVAKRSSPWGGEKKNNWSERGRRRSGNSFIHAGKNTPDTVFGAGGWRSDPKVHCQHITGHFRCHSMTASLGMYPTNILKFWSPPHLSRHFHLFSAFLLLLLPFSAHFFSCLCPVISPSQPSREF